jgi:hypothetical protein
MRLPRPAHARFESLWLAYVFGGVCGGAGLAPPRPSSMPIDVDGVLI